MQTDWLMCRYKDYEALTRLVLVLLSCSEITTTEHRRKFIANLSTLVNKIRIGKTCIISEADIIGYIRKGKQDGTL